MSDAKVYNVEISDGYTKHHADVVLECDYRGSIIREDALIKSLESKDTELAALREELATAKRNEHNSEVAYKAAIEKQDELRCELKTAREKITAMDHDFDVWDTDMKALQLRLTAAEQRNAELEAELRNIRQTCELSKIRDARIDKLLAKPTESGASE